MTDTDRQAALDRCYACSRATALAADGKRHGANRQSEAEYQTVSLVSHHADRSPRSGEIAAVFALLEEVDITGSVITLALHATLPPRHRAHYLLSVKGNASETYAALDTIDSGRHGASASNPAKAMAASDQRHIHTMKPNPGMLNYPQVKQGFASSATATRSRPGSIPAKWPTASPRCAKRLLALNRGHWTIENGNHRYRDTTFAEDACLMHTRHGPSNNAILNNMALAVIGSKHVAAAVQEFAMDRSQALRALTEPG